jgi:hypothetical protein
MTKKLFGLAVAVDMFSNTCTFVIAPARLIEIHNDFLVSDSGLPDAVAADARQIEVGELPDDMLVYLLGSRIVTRRHVRRKRNPVFRSWGPDPRPVQC